MDLPSECAVPPKKFLNYIYSRMRAFPLAEVLYCAGPLYLSHDTLSPIGCPPTPLNPPRARWFIAGPKCNPEARRTLESTFQSGVLRLIEGCDDSSVDMGRRRDVTLADVVVLVQTPGAVPAGRLVRTIDSFEFVGTDTANSSKLN